GRAVPTGRQPEDEARPRPRFSGCTRVILDGDAWEEIVRPGDDPVRRRITVIALMCSPGVIDFHPIGEVCVGAREHPVQPVCSWLELPAAMKLLEATCGKAQP